MNLPPKHADAVEIILEFAELQHHLLLILKKSITAFKLYTEMLLFENASPTLRYRFVPCGKLRQQHYILILFKHPLNSFT